MSSQEPRVPTSDEEMEQATREMQLLESWGKPNPALAMDTSAGHRKREDQEDEDTHRNQGKWRRGQSKGQQGRMPVKARRTSQAGETSQQ